MPINVNRPERPTAAGAAIGSRTRPATWLGFLAMCLGMFLAILDIQIVASSLPEIQAALVIPLDHLSWVQTAYLIAEVIAIPLTSRLTPLFSLAGLFTTAIAGFSIASVGCALSQGFASIVFCRIVQGFCGGAVIPTVFTAVFELFPEPRRVLPTTVAGLFAMVAPTLGPTVGGYITESWSWHWLFLINVGPGLLVAIVAGVLVPDRRPQWRLWRRLDYRGVALTAVALASLEIGLKEGPQRGWASAPVLALLLICAGFGVALIGHCRARQEPIVELGILADRSFAVSALYSFVLGMGLYGSVYLLPLFLGYVRQHTPLEIGETMIVGGAAQLIAAPFAAWAEKRYDQRLLTAIGYGLFAAGLVANGFATRETDFTGLFWPQILRGAGVMLCLLPTTAIALDGRSEEDLANACALFNLMRNLGGAIGIALVDTVIEQRAPVHVSALVARLVAGDPDAARVVGLPLERFHNAPLGPIEAATREFVQPLVERAGLVLAFNEAWLVLGALFAASLLALPLLRR
jgi:MFS transporter, DHA2 family, multidrug resistance protein